MTRSSEAETHMGLDAPHGPAAKFGNGSAVRIR
jgi:hypothetical protein